MLTTVIVVLIILAIFGSRSASKALGCIFKALIVLLLAALILVWSLGITI